MNKDEYISRLSDKMRDFQGYKYLEYLWQGREKADLESTICVQIPDYCDPETIRTMQGCIENAANPDRIHFAICYQGDDEEELKRIQAFRNCKVKYFAKADAPGLCAARYECNKLIDDEPYVLHIDSHMMFAQFWDVCLIQELLDCNDDKAIISAYAPNCKDYMTEPVVTDKLLMKETNGSVLNALFFTDNTVKLRFRADYNFKNDDFKARRGAFVSGHFIFARADLDRNVPSDPGMYFVADEISMAARYWTHGYNIYHPALRCVYHLYARDKVVKETRNIDVERFSDKQIPSRINETARMEQLFRVCDHGMDLTGFDLGTERSIEAYQKFAGIDFTSKDIMNFARKQAFDVVHSDNDLKPSHWRMERSRERDLYRQDICSKKTILVMIPSFKDPYLMLTVRSLIDNADNPDRVHFAVCYQDDDMNMLNELQQIDHCKIIHILPEDTSGAGYAYHLLETMLDDEDFVLCTEAHVYAVKGWDTYLTNEIEQLGDKAVISDWMNDFDKDNLPTKPCEGHMTAIKFIANTCAMWLRWGDTIKTSYPARGCLSIRHCVFGKSQFIRDCKHDPTMIDGTAEASYTLTLWTHGYDIYHSPWCYLYHCYKVCTKFTDAQHNQENRISVPRLKLYVGIVDNSNTDVDLGEYAPGTERSVQAFEQFSGIDFEGCRLSRRAYFSQFNGDGYVGNQYLDLQELNKFMDEHNFRSDYFAEQFMKAVRADILGMKYLK